MRRQRPLAETQRMLEQTLIPSPNISLLELDDLAAAVNRFHSADGLVSEQYHLISKLSPRTMVRKPSNEESEFVSSWYFNTMVEGAHRMVDAGSSKVIELPGELTPFLAPFTVPGPEVASLFHVDIVIYLDEVLWKLVPGSSLLTWEGRVRDEEVYGRNRFLGLEPRAGHTAMHGYIVGAFARSSFLLGERAYRRVLIHAGIVLEVMHQYDLIAKGERSFRYTDVFIDNEIDRLLANDGVERGTLVCFALETIKEYLKESGTDQHVKAIG